MNKKHIIKKLLFFLSLFAVITLATFCYYEYFIKIHENEVEDSGLPRKWLYILTQNDNSDLTKIGVMRLSDYDKRNETSKNIGFYINDSSMKSYSGMLPIYNSEYGKYASARLLSDNGVKQTWLIEYKITYQRMFFKYQSKSDNVTPISFSMKPIEAIVLCYAISYGFYGTVLLYGLIFLVSRINIYLAKTKDS